MKNNNVHTFDGSMSLTSFFHSMKDRLKNTAFWFPYPYFISFGFTLLITIHILLELNPRVGDSTDSIVYEAMNTSNGSIWISAIYDPESLDLVMVTDTRSIIRWPLYDSRPEDWKPLAEFFSSRMQEIALSFALEKKVDLNRQRVIIALDQKLSFGHIQGILFSMAEVGITDYAFETIRPLK